MTHRVPKPLVPLFNRPLAHWILDACLHAGITRFAVNTHHLPDVWQSLGDPNPNPPPVTAHNGHPTTHRLWRGNPVDFFHEPTLLETGGGLKNIQPWIADEPLLIHNGDIFSSLPLEKLIAAHQSSGLPVTLALRSQGDQKRITLDPSGTRVIDLRGTLNRGPGTHVFTGIYCVNPEFFPLLTANHIAQVIPAFIELAKHHRIGAITLDEGDWLDLGDRDSYLAAHQSLSLADPIHPDARIHPDAIVENSTVGPGATIHAGSSVRNSVVWPGASVASKANLDRCIVYSNTPASGTHLNADL
jgi:NDP-sugar pyrophosphorylase family protein